MDSTTSYAVFQQNHFKSHLCSCIYITIWILKNLFACYEPIHSKQQGLFAENKDHLYPHLVECKLDNYEIEYLDILPLLTVSNLAFHWNLLDPKPGWWIRIYSDEAQEYIILESSLDDWDAVWHSLNDHYLSDRTTVYHRKHQRETSYCSKADSPRSGTPHWPSLGSKNNVLFGQERLRRTSVHIPQMASLVLTVPPIQEC